MSVDTVVLPTLPPAPNCLVKIREPLGCPASRRPGKGSGKPSLCWKVGSLTLGLL